MCICSVSSGVIGDDDVPDSDIVLQQGVYEARCDDMSPSSEVVVVQKVGTSEVPP